MSCVLLALQFSIPAGRGGDLPASKVPEEAKPTGAVRELVESGRKLRNDGNDEAALVAFDDALAKARLIEDQAGEALALNNKASVYRYQAGLAMIAANQQPPGDLLDKSRRHYEQALAAAQAAGDKFDSGYAQLYLGVVAAGRLDRDGAFRRYTEALATFKEIQDRYYHARTLMFMGATELYRRGRPEAALKHFEQALPLFREVEYWHEAQHVLRDMAVAYEQLMGPRNLRQ